MNTRPRVLLAISCLVMYLAALPQPMARAQEFQALPFPRVFDVNGKRIGPLVSTTGNMYGAVVFSMEGLTFALYVHRMYFEGDTYIYFESTDCSGVPFFPGPHPHSLPVEYVMTCVAVGGPHQTVYRQDPSGPIQGKMANSYWAGFSPNCQPLSPTMIPSIYPALPVIDLTPLFTPPFSVR